MNVFGNPLFWIPESEYDRRLIAVTNSHSHHIFIKFLTTLYSTWCPRYQVLCVTAVSVVSIVWLKMTVQTADCCRQTQLTSLSQDLFCLVIIHLNPVTRQTLEFELNSLPSIWPLNLIAEIFSLHSFQLCIFTI